MLPASSKLAGVPLVEEGSADMIPGVDLPAIVDVVSTGVDTGCPQADPPQVDTLFDDAVIDMALDDGLKTYKFNELIDKPEAASSKAGMAACNACNRKQPQKYVPSMQGNKYQVELAQITTSQPRHTIGSWRKLCFGQSWHQWQEPDPFSNDY